MLLQFLLSPDPVVKDSYLASPVFCSHVADGMCICMIPDIPAYVTYVLSVHFLHLLTLYPSCIHECVHTNICCERMFCVKV